MATIVEGQQYALTSQFTNSNNKGQSMVFVKLTDSALKAIEDYAAALSKVLYNDMYKPGAVCETDLLMWLSCMLMQYISKQFSKQALNATTVRRAKASFTYQ